MTPVFLFPMSRLLRNLLLTCSLGAGLACVQAAAPTPRLPHLSEQGQEEFQIYLAAATHRAFAIAPGGAWGWAADQATAALAQQQSLANCQANTPQKCVLYAQDAKVVFDSQAWTQLWGPYLSAAQAQKAPTGRALGQRFHDLAFTDRAGTRLHVGALAGKVLLVHFWGSWCGPCRREMPELQRLQASLKDVKDVQLLLLQVREPFATSQKWMKTQGLQLPVYDSGAVGAAQPSLSTHTGQRLNDRDIATVFPSTYVLDKHGVVVFSHFGPVDDWGSYRDFLLDAAKRSGR
jgi:thiol-disulfide isomerase/thioredoxin